jgi:cytochrome c biogenesis protein CcmG/thiol:disulfide interchange protein DsbE
MPDVTQEDDPETPAGGPADAARARRLAPLVAVAVAVVVALLVLVAAMAKSSTKDTADTPLLGQAAPVVQTQTVDGQPFDLAARRGSWVVLNFFSTWCQPCVAEHPALLQFAQAQAQQGDGGELVTVVFNDSLDAVRSFFKQHGGDWPKLSDPDGRIQVAFGVAKSPETWIIDPDGVVRARIISQVTSDQLTTLLAQLRTGAAASG